MGRTGLIIAALLMAAPVSATAADDQPRYSLGYDRCLNAPDGQTTPGLVNCAVAELKVQDARLNRAYKADMAGLARNPEAKAALLKAQRAWIAFRDADCATVRALSGGTIAPLRAVSCQLEHTARRAQALEDLFGP